MKKLWIILAAMICAGAVFAGCTEEPGTTVNDNTETEVENEISDNGGFFFLKKQFQLHEYFIFSSS